MATPSFKDAELLARSAYELIPLRSRDKVPRDLNWVHRKYDPAAVIEDARARGGNLGVRLRKSDLVIDVDPRNGGDKSLMRLAADVGLNLDASLHVITGGGGDHYYLRKPPEFATVGKLAAYPGIDFKKFGGQVVAPGSIHPETGRRYEAQFFIVGPDETPDAPERLLDLLRVRRVEMPQGIEDADRWGEISPQQLAQALEDLPIDDYGRGSHGEFQWSLQHLDISILEVLYGTSTRLGYKADRTGTDALTRTSRR